VTEELGGGVGWIGDEREVGRLYIIGLVVWVCFLGLMVGLYIRKEKLVHMFVPGLLLTLHNDMSSSSYSSFS
jgi:hypothetical protein